MTAQQPVSIDVISPDAQVFHRRPTRPDVPADALPRFRDDIWDFSVSNFADHSIKQQLNFSSYSPEWRAPMKTYFWILINEETARPIQNGPTTGRRTLTSIPLMQGPLKRILEWMDTRELTSLQDLTPGTLDELLVEMTGRRLPDTALRGIITETRRLWRYRDSVPLKVRLPPESPWEDYHPRDLLRLKPAASTNLTPRIDDSTLAPLMSWALRFVEDFADDIIAGYRDYKELLVNEYRHRVPGPDPSKRPGMRRTKLGGVLENLRSQGKGLPAHTGRSDINWTHLGRLTGYFGSAHSNSDRDLVVTSGLPVDDGSYLRPLTAGLLDGKPWMSPSIQWSDAVPLSDYLTTACFVVISYLTGMRPGEVLSIRRDCLDFDADSGLWTLSGVRWKSATGNDGSRMDHGEVRPEPWVIHPVGARAVQVLELLHDGELLFPKTLRPPMRRGSTPSGNLRAGAAKTSARMTADIGRFIEWVNRYCEDADRSDIIPLDPAGPITGSRFRRTLAWHIVRRPGGLVAAAIQYGHVATQITQGYAGNYASGFPSELALERWFERVDDAVNLERYFEADGHVSGPAATELRRRSARAVAKYVGRTIPTRRQAETMLTDPSLQVFRGDGLHCVFDMETALCARSALGPVLGDCRSACRNIARTDDDIDDVRAAIADIQADTLAPPIRHHRALQLSSQKQQIVENHEEGRTS